MASNPSTISLRSLISFAGDLVSQIPMLGQAPSTSDTAITNTYTRFTSAPHCPRDSPLSCHNSTVAPDSCCFIYPGGQLLQTQFWDTDPTVGPVDSWTLHGLWYYVPSPHFLQLLSTHKLTSPWNEQARPLRRHLPNILQPSTPIPQHHPNPRKKRTN